MRNLGGFCLGILAGAVEPIAMTRHAGNGGVELGSDRDSNEGGSTTQPDLAKISLEGLYEFCQDKPEDFWDSHSWAESM